MTTLQAPALARQKPRSPFHQKIPVYSPVTRPRQVECFGTLYNFPPRGIAQCICADHTNDNEGVHEAYEWARDDLNRIITGVPRQVTFTALQVAEHICSTDLMGNVGFVMLYGTPEEQEQQKRDADLRYGEVRRAEVEDIIAQWEAHCVALSQARPGQPPPRRPRNVSEAYKDRALFERGEDRADYICGICSEETATQEAMDAHMHLRHPGLVGTAPVVAPARPKANETVPAPIARAQPSQIAAGHRLIETAEKAKLPLSVADRKGLDHGDPDVIGDVVARLMAHRQETAEAPPAEPLQPGQEDKDPEPPETTIAPKASTRASRAAARAKEAPAVPPTQEVQEAPAATNAG